VFYQKGGTVKGRTYRTEPYIRKTVTTDPKTGITTKTTTGYRGTRVDNPNVASPYVRGGGAQSQETIDKYNQEMATIRRRFPNAKTQQDVVKLVNDGAIKPYEAQLLLQAIGNERSDAIGKTGEFSDQYRVDPETGIPFKVSNGRVTMQRDQLNRLFQEKAKAGDKRFKGWENLREDMDYETGMVKTRNKEDQDGGSIGFTSTLRVDRSIDPITKEHRSYFEHDGRKLMADEFYTFSFDKNGYPIHMREGRLQTPDHKAPLLRIRVKHNPLTEDYDKIVHEVVRQNPQLLPWAKERLAHIAELEKKVK
jgi:hypothetical protein